MKKTQKIVVELIEVHWDDSMLDTQVWWYPEEWIETRAKKQEKFKTIGYKFYKDKNIIAFANSIHYDEDGNISKLGTIFTIPVGCITKIKYL